LGNEAGAVPVGTQSANTFDPFLTRLRESHDVSVDEAIERLTHAGEAVGFDAHDLIGMLDRGLTFEELLELIESKMESSQAAA
jgi:hypothetical protein